MKRAISLLAPLTVLAVVFALTSGRRDSPSRAGSATLRTPSPDRIVILVEVCTFRKDHLGTYGDGRGLTPEIDRLAERSVVFEDAVSPAVWTKPSTASILTGLYPGVTSIGLDTSRDAREMGKLPESAVTLAERMRAAGFETVALVGNPYAGGQFGLTQGFGEVLQNPWGEAGDRLIERATERIRDEAREKPLFLFILLADTHCPYVPGDPELASATDILLPDGQSAPREFWTRDYQRIWSDYERGIAPAPAVADQLRLRYAACVRTVDRQIGDLLRAIPGNRLAALALVGDHGESFWDDGITHGHAEEYRPEVCEVPLMVSAPGLPPRRVPHVVSTSAIMPLLLHLAGVEDPEAPPPGLLDAMHRDGPAVGTAFCYTHEFLYLVGPSRIARSDYARRELRFFSRAAPLGFAPEEFTPGETAEAMGNAIARRIAQDRLTRLEPETIDVENLNEETLHHLESLTYIGGGGRPKRPRGAPEAPITPRR